MAAPSEGQCLWVKPSVADVQVMISGAERDGAATGVDFFPLTSMHVVFGGYFRSRIVAEAVAPHDCAFES